MGTQEDRAKEKSDWGAFIVWAKSQSVSVAFAEYRRLAGLGNYYALQWEHQIAMSHKTGISRPSFWDIPDNGASVDVAGGGKSMPYSGLHKG